jgi:transcriptional regulator with XRE-family HTH domain
LEKSAFSPLYEVVKAKLVAMRRAAGLNQRQLSKKLKRDHSVITRIEQGERRVDILEFYFICKACGVAPDKVAASIMREIRALEGKRRRNSGTTSGKKTKNTKAD